MRRLLFTLALLPAIACASGGDTETSGPTATGARASAPDTIVTPSGLKYFYLAHGDGPRPRPGDTVYVHGIGSFPSGEVFWNSREEDRPFAYVMDSGRAIAGFVEAMDSLRVGDRAVVIMKPELAYGDRQRGDIPPGSTLIFDYEVLEVRRGSAPAGAREQSRPPGRPVAR